MSIAPSRYLLAAAISSIVATPAMATNGMNLDAYGAKAGGMGGASMAYDSGNSAIMNNPATLTLRKDGQDVGVGLTVLQPSVEAKNFMGQAAQDYESSGDSYLMPSASYIRKQGPLAYGVGMLAQGGMGTDYAAGSFMGAPEQRSELGVMRVMFPLAYQVNSALSVAGQLEWVRATLDVKRVADMNADGMPDAYVQASDSSDFDGRLSGDGWAFKLGAHYQINDAVALGASYHSKTSLDDLTGSGTITDFSGNTLYSGKMRVEDFQWPETFAVGVSWKASDKLLLAADIKRLNWSDTMDDFRFGPDGMVGAEPQDWSDQTVYMLGGQYMLRPGLALRAGYNYGKNPVPSETLNYLFPAIVERHYTAGVGWRFRPNHSVAGSLAYSPEAEQKSTLLPLTMSHSQTTLRFNYNFHF